MDAPHIMPQFHTLGIVTFDLEKIVAVTQFTDKNGTEFFEVSYGHPKDELTFTREKNGKWSEDAAFTISIIKEFIAKNTFASMQVRSNS